jgi:uncharacterized protein
MRKLRSLAGQGHIPTRLILITIWLSLFAYAGRPLLTAMHGLGVPPFAAWLILAGAAALPALRNWSGYAILGLFSLLLVLVLVSDLIRLAVFLAEATLSVQALNYGILGSAVALSIVGLWQARCPRVKNVVIGIDGLPDELDGYRIAQLSDIHVGATIQRRFVEALVEKTNELNADAIAITGDLVDGYVDDLRDQVAPLGDLRARDGVFYVTGNHEYYWRASEWVKEVQRLGFTFLKNEHRLVRRGDALLAIAGVTDPVGRYTHKQDPAAAVSGIPEGATKILLSHRPQTARTADKLGVHVQLSGHTHGGQFFPFNLFIGFFQPIVAGLHRVGRTWLYVNRGTGYWGPPSRLGVGGEITVLTLRSE